jgi:hypothetical protein
MTNRRAVRLYTFTTLTLAILLVSAPARAQFQPRPISDPATGEKFHIEAAIGFWTPSADIHVASTALGQLGTDIDFKKDLGLVDQKFPEFHLVLRPAKKHKFRVQFIPLSYTQTATLTRNIIFNGQIYAINLPINSTLDWKAWRFGYEYDFISRDRGFAGFLLDVKNTDVSATLTSPLRSDFARAKAPIPTFGGIFRVYPTANISVTGEVTGATISWLPTSLIKNNQGHFIDIDFYATLNFTNYIGVQAGYRSFDVGYTLAVDSGAFKLSGPYFGVVVRY